MITTYTEKCGVLHVIFVLKKEVKQLVFLFNNQRSHIRYLYKFLILKTAEGVIRGIWVLYMHTLYAIFHQKMTLSLKSSVILRNH